MISIKDRYLEIAKLLDEQLVKYNYVVADRFKAGKPSVSNKNVREYRLQLINKSNDTSSKLAKELPNIVAKVFPSAINIEFHPLSPNSGKFSSVSFRIPSTISSMGYQDYDLVIARGANKGEIFEKHTAQQLKDYLSNVTLSSALNDDFEVFNVGDENQYLQLMNLLGKANPEFKDEPIVDVKARTSSFSTKKENVAIASLGDIIADIIFIDSSKRKWNISLKNINGDTFSSYSGASSLFDIKGNLQPNSPGAKFLNSFGVDLNKVQEGFDQRKNISSTDRQLINSKRKIGSNGYPISQENSAEIKKIFERAWGMNYFYVRKLRNGWQVFWIDSDKLNALASDIKVEEIRYPSKKSKQITIFCKNSEKKYAIEIRNSAGKEYPNDIKFKVR